MPALECGGVAENHSSLISLLPLENPSGLKPLDHGSFTISGLHLTFLPFTKMSFFTDKEEVQRSATALGYVAQKCTEGLVKVLKDVVNSAYAPEYDVFGIADRFLHIRLLRLLCVLGQGDADASDCMNDILAQLSKSCSLRDMGVSYCTISLLTMICGQMTQDRPHIETLFIIPTMLPRLLQRMGKIQMYGPRF